MLILDLLWSVLVLQDGNMKGKRYSDIRAYITLFFQGLD